MERRLGVANGLGALRQEVERLTERTRAFLSAVEGSSFSRRGHAELVWAVVELELAADHMEYAEAYRDEPAAPAAKPLRALHVRRHWSGARVFRALRTTAGRVGE